VQAEMIASDEFRSAHPGDQLIPAIFAAIPGGTPLTNANPLEGADQTREFALDLLASGGAMNVKLTAAYKDLLHRGIDNAALPYGAVARSRSFSAVVASIAASDEYFNEVDAFALI